MRQSTRMRDFILKNVEEYPIAISHIVSEQFGISRQAVNRHFHNLISEGLLLAKGNTRNRTYELKPIIEKVIPLVIASDLDEDKVWRQYLANLFEGFRQNIVGIFYYGFTEMYNNVIDHSEGKNALVVFRHLPGRVELTVLDDGVGIFNKITSELGLADKREAILELAKGKLTTDPENHTGEGIFFTTRMFDRYSILSGELYFSHNINDDWLLEDKEEDIVDGTNIRMRMEIDSNRTVKEVFNKYAGEEYAYGFKRTHVPLRLTSYGGENLVSRSQAKRVLARFDRFDEIILDFKGVDFIGQAFADEIFRVFKNNNPNKEILWIGANNDVKKAIENVTKTAMTDNSVKDS